MVEVRRWFFPTSNEKVLHFKRGSEVVTVSLAVLIIGAKIVFIILGCSLYIFNFAKDCFV